ncbi:hypothetical protein HHI36_018232 [Cryptolaemus montrouzieri]|uniref:Endonuclease/exonuclease/phosphatase domain-containing protein n=1 Tax=Cryptolaemus montrouzieri TaxID=559131 RepID=A0ABD2P001_9CUCU
MLVPRFDLFRLDRNVNTSDKQRGGGVKKILKGSPVQHAVDDVEQLFASIGRNAKKTIFGGVYIPSRSSMKIYQRQCEALEDLQLQYPLANFVICGDFNVPCAEWLDDRFTLCPPLDDRTLHR